ncbi:MAG: trypsin-like peptidase domain-containing protein [Ruminococcus sp.]|nr:trypsin-like peptidase domain-containing protein [Ruminococcus sp.]
MEDNNNINGGGNSVPPTGNTDGGQYIPKHEKPQPVPPPPKRPVYDAFMFEPIGFDDYDRISAAEIQAENEQSEKKRRIKRERTILVLFFVLCGFTLILGIIGIVADILRSSDRITASAPAQVVLYQNSKPEGANDLDNFKDENGRYTTEGAAAAVKECIVEIYTYKDSFRKELQGTGSGVVLSDDGYIVTNAHVLLAEGYHDVHTTDGKTYHAKVIGRDTKTDIAVIKVNNAKLQPAILGDSDEVMVGEQVIAVGNPAGLSNTVTDGIVSATGRKIKSDSTGFEMNCIQTNADISPGNSGGALVNMYGQVIGITSSKYVSSSYEGLGFAITINDAKPIIEELIKNGFIGGRFRIGIRLIDMSSKSKTELIEKELGFKLPEDFTGIYICEISDDADIANTELKVGDFITAINGRSIKTYDEFYDAISSTYSAGDKVPATCAHVNKDGEINYYNIEFMLMPDTSGNY